MAGSNPYYEKKGVIIDVKTNERLVFQYNPNQFEDNHQCNWGDVNIPGMSHPRHQYLSGGNREIRFKLYFHYEDGSHGDVLKRVNFLKSLQYPVHNGTMLEQAPHKILFEFGDLYKGVVCVLRDLKVVYKEAFSSRNNLPLFAEVDITLNESVKESVGYSKIRAGELGYTREEALTDKWADKPPLK